MKIFISHSWLNKTFADKLAGDLQGVGEIWLDSQQTKPGERITQSVADGLETTDIVITVWSRQAKTRSQWVARETTEALDAGKLVIPCLLDDTPLPDDWGDLVAIDFRRLPDSYPKGFTRLNIAIFKHGAGQLGIRVPDLEAAVNDLDGVLNYVDDYRQQQGVEGEGAYWINRILEATNRVRDTGLAFQDQYGTAASLVQGINDRMQSAWDDRESLRLVLQDVIAVEHQAPSLFQNLRIMIEQRLGDLDPAASQASEPRELTKKERKQEKKRRKKEKKRLKQEKKQRKKEKKRRKREARRDELRQGLAPRLPAELLDEAVDLVDHYVKRADGALAELQGIAFGAGSPAVSMVIPRRTQCPAVSMVAQNLAAYLDAADDLLPESKYGYFGLIDDAWLIHNTVYRLIEAQVVPAQMFDVDWSRIQRADQVVRHVLAGPILSQLEASLMQSLNIIAAELQRYQPQFAGHGGGYHPYMPQQESLDDRWMNVFSDSLGLM